MSGKFRVTILRRHCKGCGLCVEVCTEDKLHIDPHPDKRGVQPAAVSVDPDCTGCLRCATICPDAAIEIYRVAADSKHEDEPTKRASRKH
jgi:2-oxoglutarate ferredoxin oxidoreductase subunit delta